MLALSQMLAANKKVFYPKSKQKNNAIAKISNEKVRFDLSRRFRISYKTSLNEASLLWVFYPVGLFLEFDFSCWCICLPHCARDFRINTHYFSLSWTYYSHDGFIPLSPQFVFKERLEAVKLSDYSGWMRRNGLHHHVSFFAFRTFHNISSRNKEQGFI